MICLSPTVRTFSELYKLFASVCNEPSDDPFTTWEEEETSRHRIRWWSNLGKSERSLNEESHRAVSRIHLSRLARGVLWISWKQVLISTGVRMSGTKEILSRYSAWKSRTQSIQSVIQRCLGHLYASRDIRRSGSCSTERGTRRRRKKASWKMCIPPRLSK